jgi:hypothetical protein
MVDVDNSAQRDADLSHFSSSLHLFRRTECDSGWRWGFRASGTATLTIGYSGFTEN